MKLLIFNPSHDEALASNSPYYYLQQNGMTDTACRIDAVLIEGNRPPEWIKNITG